jgi:hypothetical protein
MKISQKRTCRGCAAIGRSLENDDLCLMGFRWVALGRDNSCPMEPCPKPITIKDCLDLDMPNRIYEAIDAAREDCDDCQD